MYLPTDPSVAVIPTYLPTYLSTYLSTYIPTYLHTYIHTLETTYQCCPSSPSKILAIPLRRQPFLRITLGIQTHTASQSVSQSLSQSLSQSVSQSSRSHFLSLFFPPLTYYCPSIHIIHPSIHTYIHRGKRRACYRLLGVVT